MALVVGVRWSFAGKAAGSVNSRRAIGATENAAGGRAARPCGTDGISADPPRPPPRYDRGMCRNIHTLFNFEPPATEDEVRDASLQYVRKISGFTKPSQANEEAFARAVDEIAAATRRLVDGLVTTAEPKDREVEAARAKARAAKRYAVA